MGLINAYSVAVSRIPDLFAKIRDGQAPDQFSQQLLKDWGFSSSNDRAFIPLLKALGFLSPDGMPTSLYHDYRDHSRSKSVMGKALRQSYSDLFLIKEHPTEADKQAIQGKFKSYHNVSDNVAALMSKTFFALLALAELSKDGNESFVIGSESLKTKKKEHPVEDDGQSNGGAFEQRKPILHAPGLHYNIQIHLPATKDVEVYNAIFKSLKDHLIEI
ncbi:DUF5343 domain-containing protein [Lacunimicrobium album]